MHIIHSSAKKKKKKIANHIIIIVQEAAKILIKTADDTFQSLLSDYNEANWIHWCIPSQLGTEGKWS